MQRKSGSKPPNYFVIYCYEGKLLSTAAGHVAISDGLYYFSYGSVLTKMIGRWYEEEKYTKDFVLNEEEKYGAHSKIILPVNITPEKLRTIHNTIATWGREQYDLIKHNCVDSVKLFLAQIGYPTKQYGLLPPYTPNDYAVEMRELGKEIVAQLLLQGRTEQHETDSALQKNMIEMISELPKGLKKEIKAIYSQQSTQLQFYKLLELLADKHYSNAEPKAIYSDLFSRALTVCPVLPRFVYQPGGIFWKHPIKSVYRFAKDLTKDTGYVIAGSIVIAIGSAGAAAAFGMGVGLGVLSIPVLMFVLPVKLIKDKLSSSPNQTLSSNKSSNLKKPKDFSAIFRKLSIHPGKMPVVVQPEKVASAISIQLQEQCQPVLKPRVIDDADSLAHHLITLSAPK